MRTANYNYEEIRNTMKEMERQLEQKKKEQPDYYEFLDYLDEQRDAAETLVINNKARNSTDGDTISLVDVYYLNRRGFNLVNGSMTETGRKELKEDTKGRRREKRTFKISLLYQTTSGYMEGRELYFSIILKGKVIDREPETIERNIKKYLDTAPGREWNRFKEKEEIQKKKRI